MGVATALDSLADFEEYGCVDAIITSTWLGCIADSEKFLANIIDSNEQMLNPTPFIQSTFNTVGAQVALVKSLNCYNNTFTHRFSSFESGVIDAILQLNYCCAKAVLVGVFDELTPTLELILDRLQLSKKNRGEGAVFFVLTKEKFPCSVAKISDFNINPVTFSVAESATEICGKEWSGSVADAIVIVINNSEMKEVCIENDIYGGRHSQIRIQCI